MNTLIILIAKLSSVFIKFLSLGAGSTWPGHITLFLNPHFISQIISQNSLKIVLIVGTNGKTTTAKMLRNTLEQNGIGVFQNTEGANLLNGVASSLIRSSGIDGRINKVVAIFEVDENSLPLVVQEIKPAAIILLSLFRDQLDRYGEVNSIAAKWSASLKKVRKQTELFINGDDPQLYFLGSQVNLPVTYFGLPKTEAKIKTIPHDVDSVHCPRCGSALNYDGITYSHLGRFVCKSCGFKRENVIDFADKKINYPLLGIYNHYNTHAVILVAQKLFKLPLENILQSLEKVDAAYGRQEHIDYHGKKVFLLLSKNPVGFNQSIQTVIDNYPAKKHNVVLILNDRIPDGQDVSWIWDVEFEKLQGFAKQIFVTGDRCYDMALRLKYGLATDEKPQIDTDYKSAIKKSVQSSEKDHDCIILATYSGMLEAREVLIGRKIL